MCWCSCKESYKWHFKTYGSCAPAEMLYNETMTHNKNVTKDILATGTALVVVSGKEHGVIFIRTHNELTPAEYVAKHPQEYSDNEGFFFRNSNGNQTGSGSVLEVDSAHNIKRYIKAITEELHQLVTEQKPQAILIFEPEHLKGLIVEHLPNSNHIPIAVVDYGNFVQKTTEEIETRIEAWFHEDDEDPTDPASVENGPNAEEKRKILETGKKISG